jgi:hypothetical protein
MKLLSPMLIVALFAMLFGVVRSSQASAISFTDRNAWSLAQGEPGGANVTTENFDDEAVTAAPTAPCNSAVLTGHLGICYTGPID